MTATAAAANAFVLALSLAAAAAAYARWRRRDADLWVTADTRGRAVTWALVVAYLLVHVRVLGTGRDLADLATQGPSAQNLVQAAVVLAAAAWAFHLLARGLVPAAAARGGPAFWVSAFVLVALMSTAWSVWPVLTAYRALELGVFWVLLLHLFTSGLWGSTLRVLLWAALATAWAEQLVHLDLSAPSGTLYGFAYDNESTLVAAALLLVELHATLARPSRTGWLRVAVACGSVVAFGSLATSAALAAATLVLLVLRGRTDTGARQAVLVAVVVGASIVGAVALSPSEAGDDLVAEVASLTGKEVDGVESLTGRLPLWLAIAEATRDDPLGLGFAGAERALALDIVEVEEVGWRAGHAHNGYLSGWLAAGWPGLLLVVGVFAGVWQHRHRLALGTAALVAPLLVLLAVNNLTAAAVGGQLGVPWMVMMALAAAPPARYAPPASPPPAAGRAGRVNAGRARPR